MTDWNEIREEYILGGVTQKALADRHGISVASLRRRAAEEGWTGKRATLSAGRTDAQAAADVRRTRQLALTDRLLAAVSRALEDEDELYRHVEFAKSTSGSEFICERLQALDEERLARYVRLTTELFEQQRIILGIHDYRDELSAAKLEQDERLTLDKLERQTELANRKLELELIKLEGASGTQDDSDGFLAALGLESEDKGEYERP